MTVETYLRAQVPGYPFDIAVLENAALSPIFAKPKSLPAICIKDVVEENVYNESWEKSLKYATSTLFYSAAGIFSGGSRSEQVGDVHSSLSGFIVTQSDREYYRNMGDKLRQEIGATVEEQVQEQGGMFDASCRQKRLQQRCSTPSSMTFVYWQGYRLK